MENKENYENQKRMIEKDKQNTETKGEKQRKTQKKGKQLKVNKYKNNKM